eukprot:CAMPEP_0117010212 /NCGR_PEP_ID=MMETSP0472-20121206/9061_1 /TAXON_ID=693140 ORGANISM="Tiarina fusus, Strain LIS" /NCGR_SAMPLE_ID=MMETSP0472 /ASSEMBLY_ACC=CAM_ASM_000603 /LENGTH=483 /DNA_ID=CAMNT_0004712693 /DNA_START=73 /DNA_END=1524 /DNA_ORIENTATION=-
MMLLKSSFFAVFLSAAHVAGSNLSDPTDPTCALKGASGKDVCDTAKAADGSQCVWCDIASYGFCFDEDQAEAVEENIPGAKCGDDVADDDDSVPSNDDDNTPDDYWKCLKSSDDADSCAANDCVWCDTKGGYGICMDSEAAASASNSDWFTCPTTVSDPFDTTCLAESLEMDEDACKATKDQDGNPCEWCTVGSNPFCLNAEQAEIASQFGGSCDTGDLADPLDTTCLAASIEMDEDACKATTDEDGQPCEWCIVGSTPLCLNGDQADIASQLGGSCDDAAPVPDMSALLDPFDTACVAASVAMDEDACKATTDGSGQPCEWCTVGSTPLCLNAEQADIAAQLGGSCDTMGSSDPYDTSCLAASVIGDEQTCLSTTDTDGQACEWCVIGSAQICLTGEQGDIAAQLGGSCDAAVEDPFDTSCLAASVQMDKDACVATSDEDGNACEWCTISTSQLCLNEEQAEIATQFGGDCETAIAMVSATA